MAAILDGGRSVEIIELFRKCLSGDWITVGDDVQYKIERINGTAYLFFQPTSSKKDWLDNFTFWIKPYKDMPLKWYAHKGFIGKYKSARDAIIEQIHYDNTIVIVGYSQGAALGLLAYEDIAFTYPYKTVTAKLFACPRVVSWFSDKRIQDRFYGVTIYNHKRDIVGHVPPIALGYTHVGNVNLIGKCGLISHLFHYPEKYEEAL